MYIWIKLLINSILYYLVLIFELVHMKIMCKASFQQRHFLYSQTPLAVQYHQRWRRDCVYLSNFSTSGRMWHMVNSLLCGVSLVWIQSFPSPRLTAEQRLGLSNIPTASLQRGNLHPTSALHMTLNNLMIGLR